MHDLIFKSEVTLCFEAMFMSVSSRASPHLQLDLQTVLVGFQGRLMLLKLDMLDSLSDSGVFNRSHVSNSPL